MEGLTTEVDQQISRLRTVIKDALQTLERLELALRQTPVANKESIVSTLLSAREAADMLGFCVRTLRNRIKTGDIEAKKDGRRLMVLRWSVDAYLNGLPNARKPRR